MPALVSRLPALPRSLANLLTDGACLPCKGEIGRLLGARWKEMNDSQKKPYQDMADRDKTRAETEKKAYVRRSNGVDESVC